MTRKPRQIIGSDPLGAIPKDYNRYCDRIIGNGASLFLEPETITHVARVVADGGYVLDIPYLDSFFKDAKYSAVPYIADIVNGYSPDWGMKGITTASKLYSITGAAFDIDQVIAVRQPVISLADLNGRTRLLFDGAGQFIGPVAYAGAQPNTRILGGVRQITWKSGAIFVDGNTTNFAQISDTFGASPDIRLRSPSNTTSNSDLAVGADGHIRGLFNGASSKLQVDSNAETAGDCGANAPDGLSIGSNPSGSPALSLNMAKGFYVELSAAVDADYAAKAEAIYNFSKGAYGTP